MNDVASLEKPIEGYEGVYWIGADGKVRTIVRKGTKGEYLKTLTNRYGYKFVGLTKDGKRRNFTIHRLLARHFLPNPEGYEYVNHIDGNKANNDLLNLEWCTSSDNAKHAYATGLKRPHAVSTPIKLDKASVTTIREQYSVGNTSYQRLADEYGIAKSTVERIVNRKIWKEI